jgi:hypothetical protein
VTPANLSFNQADPFHPSMPFTYLWLTFFWNDSLEGTNMAQRTLTILSDDLDGKEGKDIATVTFGFDGSTYEIDLSKKNRAALEKALSPYIDAARKVTSAPRRSTKKSSSPRATPEDREWLRANGFPNVKDRGRLPGEAIEALRNR